MLTDSLQHGHEIVVRIDVVQPAGSQPALYIPNMFGAQGGPCVDYDEYKASLGPSDALTP